jgi:hypothetical protein
MYYFLQCIVSCCKDIPVFSVENSISLHVLGLCVAVKGILLFVHTCMSSALYSRLSVA